MRDLTTAAILLAAGGSTRMGRPKQLLTYRGETLIHRAARVAIDAGCSPLVVVLGANAALCAAALADLSFTRADNADWARGIGSSIRCGVEALRAMSKDFVLIDHLLILLGDQPQIDASVLRALRDHPDESPIIASKFGDELGPPVRIARSEFAALSALPDNRGAKSVWHARPALVTPLACPAAAIDIDTPEDWARLAE